MSTLVTIEQLHPEIASGGMVDWPAEKGSTTLGPVSQPTIAIGPDGELIANSSQVNNKAVILFHSRDAGITWDKLCEVDVNYGPRPDFYSGPCGCGYLRDGTMLITYSWQFNDSGKYADPYHDESHGLRTFVIRSTDHGRTWSEPQELDPWPFEGIGGESSRIHQGPDGTIFLPIGGQRMSRPGRPLRRVEHEAGFGLLFVSSDNGRSWRSLSYVGPHLCEMDVLSIDQDVILVTSRYQRKKMHCDPPDMISPYALDPEHFKKRPDCECRTNPKKVGLHSAYKQTVFLKSTDGGRTWSRPRLVTGWLQQTACLTRLKDGTIVMPFSHKDQGAGQRFIVSYDEGETWSKTVFDLNRGGMYASSVALPDDTIVTVHDQTGRGNLQVLRWRIPPKSKVSEGGFFVPQPVAQP